MRNNDRYRLLYNQLWVGTTSKFKQLNVDYVYPEYLDATTDTVDNISKAHNNINPLPMQQLTIQSDRPATVQPPQSIHDDVLLIKDWDVLVDQINNCTKCSLCDARKNVVIERGSRNAEWMFVGEGPGEQEDLVGSPFVGASGQLLDKMIAAMNLNKNLEVYICNVVKCRPPYNRNPEVNEIEACKNYLLNQINNVRPKIIIALGRFASQTLLESNIAIGKLRNKVHYFQSIPLIVTYHPSYLLRNPSAKKEAWDDLQLAMRTYK